MEALDVFTQGGGIVKLVVYADGVRSAMRFDRIEVVDSRAVLKSFHVPVRSPDVVTQSDDVWYVHDYSNGEARFEWRFTSRADLLKMVRVRGAGYELKHESAEGNEIQLRLVFNRAALAAART